MTYDEDTGYGLLRHVLVRRGFSTGEIMVVLVTVSPIFPSKNNFVKALRKEHPEITTVVLNVNDRQIQHGSRRPEYCTLRTGIYQRPSYGTDLPYFTVFLLSGKSGADRSALRKSHGVCGNDRERACDDAYCGTGTIGIIASRNARDVIGVELNRDAIRDARMNARENKIRNVRFVPGDAGWFMEGMAAEGEKVDVVLMDPPRAGSDRKFLHSLLSLSPGEDRLCIL